MSKTFNSYQEYFEHHFPDAKPVTCVDCLKEFPAYAIMERSRVNTDHVCVDCSIKAKGGSVLDDLLKKGVSK